uniref:Zinc finger protein RFP-like n=1 Tax=Pelusios castaneus TaxID=367368 RepID=A0A8C8SS54_9SAUR
MKLTSSQGAMAAVERLQDEATCSICLEYFKAPVSIRCGHNFCRDCITQCWEESDRNFSCPQCREITQQRHFRPNRELANMVELVKQLKLQGAKVPGGERMCEKHREPLKLFCEDDRSPICMVCDRSKAHRKHAVIPIEEAAQEYKEQIQVQVQTLKEEREKLLSFRQSEEGRSQECLEKTSAERQKMMAKILQCRQFLDEQECLLMAQLGGLDKEIVERQNENVTKLSEEISRLDELISEIERKCQQPASEFLQNIGNIFSKCEKEKTQQAVAVPLELEKRISDFSQQSVILEEMLRKFKDNLISELGMEGSQFLTNEMENGGEKADVTLDPDTAHPKLILSADRKCVRWRNTQQHLPDNPQRFDSSLCVLGSEGFISGRHYWEVEVEVGKRGGWAVGVARESVRKKGQVTYSPEGGIWAVGLRRGQYWALTSPEEIPLSLGCVPQRIRVSLDYPEGQVAFFDADHTSPIFTFLRASFKGERVHPFFWVVGNECQLQLPPSEGRFQTHNTPHQFPPKGHNPSLNMPAVASNLVRTKGAKCKPAGASAERATSLPGSSQTNIFQHGNRGPRPRHAPRATRRFPYRGRGTEPRLAQAAGFQFRDTYLDSWLAELLDF